MSTIKYIRVPAVVTGNRLTLVNESGKPIGKEMPITEIGELDRDAEFVALWRPWAKRVTAYLSGQRQRHRANQDAWLRKAQILASSFRIRGKRRVKRKSTQKKQPGARRTTWYTACSRMQQQANARNYRNNRDPWHKWASTVAGNANKRAGGQND